jgi:hypothetical protein
MKFLEEKFKFELDQGDLVALGDGVVIISGFNFEPRQILEIASENKDKPTIYDQAFNAWKEDYIGGKISDANFILEKNDQQARFAALQSAFDKSQVIPFVGAGMSCNSGLPLWRQFLISLQKSTTINEADFISLLDNGQYEEAAERIAQSMPPQLFAEKIYTNYGTSVTPAGAIELLPEVFQSHVITTNFDHLLREVYKSSNKPFVTECLGYQASNIRRDLGNGSVLVKLHGHADNGAGRVFTKTEYEKNYEIENKFDKLIEVFASRFSILFLGCSLSVDRPIKALKSLIDKEGYEAMPMHYAFLPLPNTNQDRVKREHELSQHHIYPIWYPSDDHDESITALLIKLREDQP